LPADIKSALETNYPYDLATGYHAGELRGAFSVEQPMDIPLRDAGNK